MLEHKKIQNLSDYFVELNSRQDKGVYFYRINGYSEEIGEFIKKYYDVARRTGVVIEGKIPNPDEGNLSYYNEIMGMEFQMNIGFILMSLRKWLPRMNEFQRQNVADSIYDSLDSMRRSGKTENMLKNAYIKFMCWLYYKFERIVNQLGENNMYKKNILVSHKAAFSDSAYMNVLFSDKTGTITQGNLSLVEFITGSGDIVNSIQSREFIEAITLNNLAKISSEGKAIGSNNMDRALLSYAISNGYNDSDNDPDKVEEISGFDSEKKCATVKLKNGLVYWKGATENIIDKVTHYMLPDGEEREFTKADKAKVEEQMHAQAKRTMKLLSVAKIGDGKTVLMAVLCLRDNVRTDAVETVQILNDAGIQVVMVTGDAEETAVAIAKEAGILKDEKKDVVLTHEQLEKLSDEELKKVLPNLKVVSRAKPLDKKRLVSVSQQIDNVCGMTGDGVNDAPALKQADIGFAMGDGTAVAQEAGDVVILNNSLTSIKDCVLNSRTMAKSVGKFLIFQLTVNISTLLMNILAPILGWTEPFSIVQILWINLIMDTLAAMAFGGEPILNRYMKDQPAKRTDNILTSYIKSAIGVSAIFITLGSILILENIGGITTFVTPAGCANPELYEKTFMFAFFIYAIIFNSLNTRSEKFNLFEHIGENKNFALVMGGIFILQTIIIEIGGQVFSTTMLEPKALLVSMALAVLIIPVDLIRKAIMRK
ncbi:MAG: HAD-IC family P-type ATPase [Blautia sp.]|uniref:HAD-IC family P-type ATPase n=3 Tax=unclassified Blautia TaxID=2648079 RepID=UPI0026223019|nr:HAD-IC family P-type ATPase [Blautia sp.]MDD6414172.1 HAD-IC family P-type ATPase [Blautia sp.]